ncbi:MAG: cyclic nucleotide-binding/CBS domain-containing protein [Actinomycetota bacterium]
MTSLSDIMTGDVFTTTSETSVVDAARGMAKGRLGSALVMNGSWLVGIITERDVLRAVASGNDLNRVPVKDWMTRDPVTSSPETDTEEAAGIMLANGFRHLPITEGAGVVGIVSLRDVLSARVRRRPR